MSSSPGAVSHASRGALVAAFATIYVVWGSTYLGNRYAIESIPPFLMAAGRVLIAGIVLGAWMRWRGAPAPTRRQVRDNAIIGVLLLTGGSGLVAWAQQYIPSGLTALIIGASPLFFSLVEWAWPGGQPPGVRSWIGLLAGFAGVTWLAAPWEGVSAGGIRMLPTLVILFGSVSWAVGSIYSRHTRDRAHPLIGASVQMIIGGLSLLGFAALHGEFRHFHPTQITASSALAFAYLVIVGSLIAFPTFIWLTQHSTPTRVSTYAYINPIVAIFLGWLVADEPVGPRTLAAAALILTAVAIITLQKNRDRPAASRPAPAASSSGLAGVRSGSRS